jgi:hypothetical protein
LVDNHGSTFCKPGKNMAMQINGFRGETKYKDGE